MRCKIVESAITKLRCVTAAHVAVIGLTALVSASVGAGAVSLTEQPELVSAAQSNPPDTEISIADGCAIPAMEPSASDAVEAAAQCASAAARMAQLYRRVEWLVKRRVILAYRVPIQYGDLVNWVFHPDWSEYMLIPTAASIAAGGVLRRPDGQVVPYQAPPRWSTSLTGHAPHQGGQPK